MFKIWFTVKHFDALQAQFSINIQFCTICASAPSPVFAGEAILQGTGPVQNLIIFAYGNYFLR